MVLFVLLTVSLALGYAVPLHRSAGRAADRRMAEIYEATRVPLSPEATARLRPVVVRRTAWPTIGRMVGLVITYSAFLFLVTAQPGRASTTGTVLVGLGGGAAAAFGLAAGGLAGHVAAGYRGFPSLAGSVRTVRVSARRPADYVTAARRDAWRCSAAALGATVVLDALLLSGVRGGPAVLGAGMAALLLTAVSLAVRGIALRRPVPGPSRDELLWQEAVLADTLQLVTSASVLLNTAGVVLGLGAVLALRDQLAVWGAPVAATVAAVCLLAGALLARPLRRDDRPPALQRQDLAA
jgi:hypothetical protein